MSLTATEQKPRMPRSAMADLTRYGRYLIPAFLAFLFALFLWQIQKDRKRLEYEVIESAFFPRESGAGKYFVVRLLNQGNVSLEHIEFDIAFAREIIESSQFADPKLVTDVNRTPSNISGLIPLLNPDELVSVTITTLGENPA